MKLLVNYARLRREADAAFDMAGFARAYAILGAQRATKILGIFARLDLRDRKPAYLAHLPRVESSLKKSLRHPALGDIKAWYELNLPATFAAV
jgi:aminoglycoside/choline kinase family phosphotransferase